jgi:Protein of unknown function (DUF3631)
MPLTPEERAAVERFRDGFSADEGPAPPWDEAVLLVLRGRVNGSSGDSKPEPVQNPDSQGETLPPEAVGNLLDATLGYLDHYIVLPGDAERYALALWIAHTWAIDGAYATPYLLVVSPEKRSGKTRLLEVLELLVASPWRVIGASEAALFRKIAKDRPTLLLDELDAVFASHAERTEPLRAALNGGNRPGAAVSRCIGEGRDVEDYSVFCAKVLAGIDSGHQIPDTIRDRSVTIHMQRKTEAESVERFRRRHADANAEPIRDGFRSWAQGATKLLLAAEPETPLELDDRAADAWEPLFAIANMAGGDWPERAREAAVALSGGEDRGEVATGALLLAAIRAAFGTDDRIRTGDLLARVNADEELPFGGWRDGKGLDSRGLARLIRPYGVRPRSIRIGDDPSGKGYLREQFADAWERWLPPTQREAAQTAQTAPASDSGTETPLEKTDVPDVPDVPDNSGCTPGVPDMPGCA